MSRNIKRAQLSEGSYHDSISFNRDDYHDVHFREGRLVKAGANLYTAPAVCTVTRSDKLWNTTTSWAPSDDPEFALDPDSVWYDEAVEGPVMSENRQPKKKKAKSNISV